MPPEGPVIRRVGDSLLVGFRVSPSAARTAVKGLYGDRVKVAINAPAEDGRANAELVEALARWMGLMRDTIRVKNGQASRDKVLSFEGIEETELASKLAALVREDRSRK